MVRDAGSTQQDRSTGPSGSRRGVIVALAAFAAVLILALVAWLTGFFEGDDAEPTGGETSPTTPGPTDATDEPSDDPTEDPTDDPTTGAGAIWAQEDFPACGQSFALPEGDYPLTIDNGPPGAIAPGGGWVDQVSNTSDEQVRPGAAIPWAVVLNDAGEVVAAPEEYLGPAGEGTPHFALAAGQSTSAPVSLRQGCDGEPLTEGDYEVVVVLPIGEPDDDGGVEVGVGGPWPLTVAADGDDGAFESPGVEGSAPFNLECDAPWDPVQPDTGVELTLIDQVRTPREQSDSIEGRLEVTTAEALDGVSMFTYVALVSDGMFVSAPLLGSDDVAWLFMSADTSYELWFSSELTGCDFEPLPPGEYELVVMALTMTGEDSRDAIAVSQTYTVTLE